MAIGPPSDAALVRYLLGQADREDEERFDELSVTDAAFADRLREIEQDLADAYVRGELSPSDRERWKGRYLASQHGRDDLALAEALAARDAEVGGRGSEVGGRTSEVGIVVGRVLRPGAWWSLAAAAVLVAVIGGYRLLHREQPPVSVAQQPPQVATRASAPASAVPVAHVIALTLTPSVRSIDQPPTLEIPAGTTDVRLTLRLEPDARDRYGVLLRELATNRVAWQADAQIASAAGPERTLVISIPASTFHNGRYLINVFTGSSTDHEIVASYTFVVVLQ